MLIRFKYNNWLKGCRQNIDKSNAGFSKIFLQKCLFSLP